MTKACVIEVKAERVMLPIWDLNDNVLSWYDTQTLKLGRGEAGVLSMTGKVAVFARVDLVSIRSCFVIV